MSFVLIFNWKNFFYYYDKKSKQYLRQSAINYSSSPDGAVDNITDHFKADVNS